MEQWLFLELPEVGKRFGYPVTGYREEYIEEMANTQGAHLAKFYGVTEIVASLETKDDSTQDNTPPPTIKLNFGG